MKIRSRGSTERELAVLLVLSVVLVGLACGCATVDNAGQGVPVDTANRPLAKAAPPPLVVSASEAPSYSTAYLGLVEVTFENRTAVWKQVDRVTLDFASADDVDAWERAITIRCAIQGTSSATAIEALGMRPVDRLGVWIGQHHRAAAAADDSGGPAATGAEASTVPAATGAEASTVPPPSYPDQRLLTTPFRIPPGLFTKRWILLSTSANRPAAASIP
jgi:hypothetical protein